jgi:large subunit ribosomal protein L3
MIGLLGKKLGMTQYFDDNGRQVPVTVIEVGPCKVTDIRTAEKNGYTGVQIAYGDAKVKRVNKARQGQFKKAGVEPKRYVREIRTKELEGLKVGAELRVDNFEAGDFVDVIGVSIGRGFQGTVKRHHFKGALTMGHGDMQAREPGSIGASSFPSRVVKGMRMSGHMGDSPVTIQNLKVVGVDGENNLLLIKGSVPGAEGGCLIVKSSLKRGKPRKWKVQGQKGAPEQASNSPEKPQEPAESEKS